MTVILLAVAAFPLVVAFLVVGFRRPAHLLLPAFAFFVPFGSGLALPSVPSRYGSISSLLMVALIAAIFIKLVSGRWRPERVTVVVAVWLGFVGVAATTVFWSVDVPSTLVGILPFAGIVILYVALRLSPLDRVSLARTEVAIVCGGATAAGYGIYQFATSTLPTSLEGGGRFGRDLLDPNHTAAALTLPLAIALGKVSDRSTPKWSRVCYFLVILSLLAAILLTGSRGGLVAVGVVFVVMLATSRRRALTFVTLAVVVGTLFVLVDLNPALVPARLLTSDSSGRTDIWKVGFAACPSYCGTGSGWGTFGLVYANTLPTVPGAAVTTSGVYFQPHNIWILAGIETGIVGLGLMTLGLALAVTEVLRLPKAVRAPPLAALTALLASGFVLSNLEFKYFWMVLIYCGLCARVHVAERDRTARVAAAPNPLTSGHLDGEGAMMKRSARSRRHVRGEARRPAAGWTGDR